MLHEVVTIHSTLYYISILLSSLFTFYIYFYVYKSIHFTFQSYYYTLASEDGVLQKRSKDLLPIIVICLLESFAMHFKHELHRTKQWEFHAFHVQKCLVLSGYSTYYRVCQKTLVWSGPICLKNRPHQSILADGAVTCFGVYWPQTNHNPDKTSQAQEKIFDIPQDTR